MAINIKNREVEAYLGEIRSATGKGITEIVLDLTRDEAERLRRVRDYESRLARMEEASRQAAAKIPPDAPSADEIIGYDEWGLPT
jgi:antitoxin VapB